MTSRIQTTYSIKAYPPASFPIYREGLRTSAAMYRMIRSLTSLGYADFTIYLDKVDDAGTITRQDITDKVKT